tara:strand:+ start:52 stop:237 length:186 start_codon:yes stop_codon:yes gene_type:complete
MRATCGMDVVIARNPAMVNHFDPAFQLKLKGYGHSIYDSDVVICFEIFRASGDGKIIFSRR